MVGKTVDEAKKELKGYLLEYAGSGNTVIYQSPEAKSYVKDGGTIKILLG